MKLPVCSVTTPHSITMSPVLRKRPHGGALAALGADARDAGSLNKRRRSPVDGAGAGAAGPRVPQTPASSVARSASPVRDPSLVPDLSTLRIDTPMLAQRQVLKLRLPNDLDVLLISDPGIPRSGASLTVRAGSFDNPPEGEGMAHFVEHMLFMGTRKYPGENDYTRYLAEYAGDHNAYTSADHTQYMLACNNAGFAGAVERFASFFTEPLFASGSLQREREAVNAEFLRYHDDEGSRQAMVAAQLANPGHPASRFTIGSLASLAHIDSEQLRTWYEEHYSANLMHLVLYSDQPLSTLRSLAEAHFAPVPNRKLQARATDIDPVSDKARGHLTYVESRKKSEPSLSLNWTVPEKLANDLTHAPLPLIAYVLGHGHPRSLQAVLKEIGWATGVVAQTQNLLQDSGELILNVKLTEAGARHHEEILALCFAAIAQIQKHGIPAYVFDEIQQTSLRQYRFQSRNEPFKTVSQHGRSLLHEDLGTYPDHVTAPNAFDAERIAAVVKKLTPQACGVMLAAHRDLVPWTADKHEPYMGVGYRHMPLNAAAMQSWQQAANTPADFAIVPRNPFIPQHLTTVPLTDDVPTAQAPKVLQDDDFAKIFFARDVHEKNPEIWWRLSIKSPTLVTPTAQDRVLAQLYAAAVQDALTPTLDAASIAGLDGDITATQAGFGVQVSGFADKAPILLDTLLKQLRSLTLSETKFAEIKTTLLHAYADARRESAIDVARDTLDAVRDVTHLTPQACYQALEGITASDVRQFGERDLADTYVVATLLGSMEVSTGEHVKDLIKTHLAGDPCPQLRGFDNRVFTLPEQALSVSDVAECDASTVIVTLDHGGFDVTSAAALRILDAAISERFFDALRTKQKAGYAVGAYSENYCERLYSNFLVENNRHDVGDVRARIEQFIEGFVDSLGDGSIDAAEYARLQQSTRLRLEEPNRALADEGKRLHNAVATHGDIQRSQKIATAIGALPYEAFVEWAKAHLSAANRRRLAVLISGTVPPQGAVNYQEASIAQVRACAAGEAGLAVD